MALNPNDRQKIYRYVLICPDMSLSKVSKKLPVGKLIKLVESIGFYFAECISS